MKTLLFIKMHGLGNDYVFVDCFQPEINALIAQADIPALARRISDRHRGVGSDGLVLILPDENADARMRMFNADGTEAQMCGNAIRCVGKYLYESGLCPRSAMRIATLAGVRELALQVSDGLVQMVTVDMGTPVIAEDELSLDDHSLSFFSVNIGNPHAVFFRDVMPDTETIHRLGAKIEKHPHFPEGTNVEFIVVRNPQELDMRVWERGTGETQACGTGACASAVAAMHAGYTEHEVTVHLLGGDLIIRLENDIVYMTGTATEAFRGQYLLED